MPLPSQPVNLTPEQVADLNGKLSSMRHGINNKLAVIAGTVEVIRLKPERTPNMLSALVEQLPQISDALTSFSAEFERAVGITRQ
jgi:hypothetical protein